MARKRKLKNGIVTSPSYNPGSAVLTVGGKQGYQYTVTSVPGNTINITSPGATNFYGYNWSIEKKRGIKL